MADPIDPIVSWELTKYAPRVDFDPREFRGQIQKWGHRVRWERASRCPCGMVYEGVTDGYTVRTKAGNVDCPNGCRGTGYLYGAPQEIRALINDASGDKKLLQAFGERAFGSVRITTLPEHLPGWRDRCIDLDGIRVFKHEPRKRTGTVEVLDYPIVTRELVAGTPGNPTQPLIRKMGIVSFRVGNADGSLSSRQPIEEIDYRITSEGWLEHLGAAATGVFQVSGSVGTVIPAGTRFVLAREGEPDRVYATSAGATIGVGGVVQVPGTCIDTGTVGNIAPNTTLSLATPIVGVSEVRSLSGFENGQDTPNGPRLGEWYTVTFTTYPVFIIRSEPHLYRHTYVARKPFVNVVDGFRGYWSPAEGVMPAAVVQGVGDYFEVYENGTLFGQAFQQGDVLVATAHAPSASSFEGWFKIADDDSSVPVDVIPISVMCLAWLEDMGDPFGREATR